MTCTHEFHIPLWLASARVPFQGAVGYVEGKWILTPTDMHFERRPFIPNKRGTDFETELPQCSAHVKAKFLLPWPSNVHFKPGVFERGGPPHHTSNMQNKVEYPCESAPMHWMS